MATPVPSNAARFTLAEVAAVVAGRLVLPAGASASDSLCGVAIDSRAVTQGSLFVAIRGAQQDGVRYVEAAARAGAKALLVPEGAGCPDALARIEVADTTAALGALAAFHRRRWGGRVVAITGSAGKTTAKELTAAALAGTGARVLKTQGNLNNQFGVPMMIFCLGTEHDTAVLEVGTSAPGEIAYLGSLVQPDVATVLLAALAHVEGLPSLAAVADEKASLWGALAASGTAVVNADDPELMRRLRHDVPVLSYGQAERASVRLLGAELRVTGTEVRLAIAGGGEHTLRLRLLGHAAALNACAALASVLALCGPGANGARVHAAIAAMEQVEPVSGRMVCIRTGEGVTICDDTYNANPSSVGLGLETLRELARQTGGRSFAVLGDMKELGTFSQAEHARLGEIVVRLGIDALVGCGPDMAQATAAAARISAGRLAPHPTRVAHVLAPLDAVPIVKSLCRAGDVVFVKGSRSMGMEQVVASLTEKLGGAG